MSWKLARLAVGLLFIALSPPVAADDVRYFGNTTTSTFGNAGVIRFNQLCNAAFPTTGARICTSEEIVRNGGALPAADANGVDQWVHPTITSTFTTGTLAVDFSGRQATPANLSCNGWSSAVSTVTGLVITSSNNQGTISGQFNLSTCNLSRNVACCARIVP